MNTRKSTPGATPSSPLHIAFLSFVDPSGKGGENVFSNELIAALSRLDDVEVTVIAPRPTEDRSFEPKVGRYEYLPEKRSRSPAWILGVQIPIWRAIRRAQRANGSLAGFITTLRAATLLPPIASFLTSLPQVLVVEGLEGRNVARMSRIPGTGLAMNLIAWMNALASERVFVAYEAIRSWLVGMPGIPSGRVERFHHGVDESKFPSLSKEEARSLAGISIPLDASLIGWVGSFKWYHRVDVLVRGVARMEPPAHLLLVGDGPKRPEVVELVRELDLENRVHLAGFVPHEQVCQYMAACDVLYGAIDPSHWGNPIKVYEYLAVGRPVVAHRSEDLMFLEKCPFAVTLGELTPDAVASSLTSLLQRREGEQREMGKEARAQVLDEWTWDALATRMVTALRNS